MNTFVFGAGASIHAGYPLAKRMGNRLFRWMETHGDEGPYSFRSTVEFLREEFECSEDIEQLLTSIDERITAGQNLRPRPSDVVLLCQCHKPTLIAAIRIWFVEIRQNEARDYATFAEQIVAPGDCTITFNYDVSLESALQKAGKWWLGDGYGFALGWVGTPSPVRVLKLHGSVNWRFPVGWNGRPWIDSIEVAFLGYPDRSDPLYRSAIADGAGTMILPSKCKQFFTGTSFGRVHEEFWNHLWDQASLALNRCERIVVCGYSVPEVDARACELLLRGNYSAPIEVCCGTDTESIVERFRSLGRDARAADQTHFDKWLNSRIPSD
jgi:hypothetical protein